MALTHEFQIRDRNGALVSGHVDTDPATEEPTIILNGHHMRSLTLKQAKEFASDILGAVRAVERDQRYKPLPGQTAIDL